MDRINKDLLNNIWNREGFAMCGLGECFDFNSWLYNCKRETFDNPQLTEQNDD